MSLAELRLEDLRCLERADLELDRQLNLISGDNGSGKTSLLEAIYLLGRGRSFRTRYTAQLIRHGAPRLWVHGRTSPEPGHTLGLECARDGGLTIRIDRAPADSRVQLSEIFPVQVIDPGIHRLVEEGPALLRRWQGYMRALKQRNAALQSGMETASWDSELIRLGELLTAARSRLVESLQ